VGRLGPDGWFEFPIRRTLFSPMLHFNLNDDVEPKLIPMAEDNWAPSLGMSARFLVTQKSRADDLTVTR
jgi:hypothetical protein